MREWNERKRRLAKERAWEREYKKTRRNSNFVQLANAIKTDVNDRIIVDGMTLVYILYGFLLNIRKFEYRIDSMLLYGLVRYNWFSLTTCLLNIFTIYSRYIP